MPPFVPRKRQRSPSPVSTLQESGKKPAVKRAKSTVFDAIDTPPKIPKKSTESKKLLEELNDDEDESLSEADSDDFEDVAPAKRRKGLPDPDTNGEDEDDDDEMDWEDAIPAGQPSASDQPDPEVGDISFSLKEDGSYVDPGVSIPGVSKKGPSKRERQARIHAHCLHVQSLMWHNTIRNSWINDKEVQKTLVDGLTEGVKREVTRWREAMGTLTKQELEDKKKAAAAKALKGKRGRKGKDKSTGRDWNYGAQHAEHGVPNLSAGDPLLRLLKVLTAYWRKRFTITAPGLRKQGHMSLKRLRDELKHWERHKSDHESHGERIEDIGHFRKLAKECEGSRDVGAQLFAALLRGLAIDTRLVASLQSSGFGWSKGEDADAKKIKAEEKSGVVVSDDEAKEAKQERPPVSTTSRKAINTEKPTRISSRANKAEVINLDSDSPLSSAPSDEEPHSPSSDEDDDLSIVDVTPATPKRRPNKRYDRDLAFPTYWVEVRSPATNKYIPVDPIVLSTIASNDELLPTFEPRGKKAEKAKQVICYAIGFSADGTAKDVTVRYLKKHQLPGKTKGMRLAAERVPIYNRKGKVKRYEEYDWFRTVMSIYDRPENKRTAADDLEDQTDLKPFKPAKEVKEVEKESLQWYKQSAEFVLEQHLRREEALVPGAEPLRTFTAGKGDKAKEHPVFRREDVVVCKTVESWHKEGRALKEGEHPKKFVAVRAVTLIRKREMEETLRETGEKLKQGLYSIDQTDWIIPPPIQDGIIPKNAFGNMDVYVPTMVPEGAVHVPLKGSAKLCRRLDIDYAEACTGFEFGKQRAVPVLTGVVVAEEHELLVRDAWKTEQAEIKRKEDTKRTAAALQWWRKMLLGLRVIERMRVEYAETGGDGEESNPFVRKAKREGRANMPAEQEGLNGDEGGGGFFPEGHDEEEVQQRSAVRDKKDHQDSELGGGFLDDGDADEVDDVVHEPADGGFLVEDEVKERSEAATPVQPRSLQSLHENADDESSDDDAEPVKPTKNGSRKPVKKSAPPRRASRKVVEEAESSLSEPPSEEDKEDTGSEDDHSSNDSNRKHASPQVVISSRKTRAPPRKARIPARRNAAKKSTPLKSQYFAASADSPEDDEGEDEEESEVEVVKPRATTARTRSKRS